jgi:ectoine hydroxylase-related dioxygenase (phytanoyl-CoA dioxygenase family)
MSRSAVTIWAPLTPINREMGYLKLVPGSHTHLLPVELNEHGTVANFTQHKRLRIWNEESQVADFERQAIDADSVEPGDVLFFHSHLLHRSGQNNSDRARWVFNSRLGDIADAEVVGRRWRCARFRDLWPVKDIHPEKVHLAS